VILQEIGQAADIPEDVAFDAFQETAFPDQPVGRPVLGDPEVVRTVSREAMIDYMAELYRCPRIVVSAAGNVDHAAFVDLATEKLADLRPGTSPEAEPSRYVGGERRIERPGEQVNLVFGFPGLPYGDPDYYAALVLSTLYGGGMSSRLFQEIREKRGLVYSVYSFASSLSDSGVFGVYAGTGPEEADDVLRIAAEQLRDVAASAGEDETQRARAQLKAHLMMSMESTGSRAEQAANQLLIYGRLLDPAEVVAELEAIDSSRIRSAAERVLAGPMTLTAVGPIGGIAGFERVCGWFR
jgi:predicted Zn-dependent peptidase